MRIFWKNKKQDSINEQSETLNAIRAKVEERKILLDEMRTAYNPANDKKESRIWYFMHSDFETRKVSVDHLKTYQDKYKVQLPDLIVQILSEIGSGALLNHNFTDRNGELYTPCCCFEFDFLKKCLNHGISPMLLENNIRDLYDLENNCFQNEEIQAIYESLNSNRDQYIVVLFALGGHDAYITLNREKKEQIAIYNVPCICNHHFVVDDVEYDIPYYKYLENSVKTSILQNMNTAYWRQVYLEDIKEMNR